MNRYLRLSSVKTLDLKKNIVDQTRFWRALAGRHFGHFQTACVNVRKLCTDNTKWNLVFKMTDRPAKSGCIYNFLSSFQWVIVISSQFTFLHRGGISQTNLWDFWSSRFRNFENCESLNFNLGQKKMEQKTPIPPNQGRSREKSKRRHWSLILDLGERRGTNFPSILSKIVWKVSTSRNSGHS